MRDAGTAWRYVPFDVSESVVRECASTLGEAYPALGIHGVVGDFERHLDAIPPRAEGRPRVVALLGGTLGNLPPGSRRRFLRTLAALLGPGDHLLLGTDLVKDPDVIEAAYDDAPGRDGRVQPQHPARRSTASWTPTSPSSASSTSRSSTPTASGSRCACAPRRACRVRIAALGLDVAFARGEEMRTEISAKFTPERVAADCAAAGLERAAWLTDPGELFALSLARPAG